jgi:uncharacterized protein involved in exopolysaccharide biosynthesis
MDGNCDRGGGGVSSMKPQASEWNMAYIAGVLRRQARVVLFCFLALSAGVIGAMLASPPVYEGELKILVKRDRADSVVSGAADPALGHSYRDLSETEVMSQVELLKSRELLERVASETGLATQIKREHPSISDAEAVSEAADDLRERLGISPVKRTWLIDVRYEDHDRRVTRSVLDTLARFYLEKHLALQRPAGTYQFFVQQTQVAREELDSVRDRFAAYNAQHQVVSAAREKEAVLEKLSEFDAMQIEAAALRSQADRRIATVSDELSRVPRQHTSALRSDPDVLRDIKGRILTLELQRTELLQKFTPKYRGVMEIDEHLQQARASLEAAELAPVREETIADNPTRQWLDTELARTRADRAAMDARVEALSTAVGRYRTRAQALDLRDAEQHELERELKAAETKYLLYAQKREEARISDELDRTRIANVVVAEGPSVKFEPQRDPSLAFLPLLLGAALLLSGGLAVAVDALTPAYQRWKADAGVPAPIIGHVSPSEEPLS